MLTLTTSIVIHEINIENLARTLKNLSKALLVAETSGSLKDPEIFFVLNGIEAGWLQDFMRNSFPSRKHQIIKNEKNIGFGAAHNQALAAGKGDLHLFLNPDAFLEETSVQLAITHMEDHPSVALLGPQGFNETGNPIYLAKRFPSLFDLALRGFAPKFLREIFDNRLSYYEYRDLAIEKPCPVLLLSGCALLGRQNILEKIGGFDESFFLYFEDYDLSLRAAKHGEIVYLPDMKITHLGGNTSAKGIIRITRFFQSALKFYLRHGIRFF